ncbi:MAG: hypothetical protein ACRDRJ_25020 [Streptosporangiaceae bacterium]
MTNDRHQAGGHQAGGHHAGVPRELTELLDQIVPSGAETGGFGHREHVHLAFLAVRRYHLAADQAGPGPADFDSFAARHPRLLDKRLLRGHYSSSVLASARARASWVEPDLAPFPWRQR